MKFLIVGGVAAGASAAARLRRLNEQAEIILFERGKNISYANCGLPYHLGKVIPERDDLLVMPVSQFQSWFNIEVRTEQEVTEIDREGKKVRVRTANGEYTETYDKLLLATGAKPVGDAFTDADYPHVAHLWTIADMDRVLGKLGTAKKAVVVGAGFIGLEVAENLNERGLEVTIIQRGEHVLPTIDAEMAVPLAKELRRLGVRILFGRTVETYREKSTGVDVVLDDSTVLDSDIVIVATGVVPNSSLAQKAGLTCGARGHIIVNEHLQTSDPDIYAAGDVTEVVDPVFGGKTAIALAGPANKQGRIAADNMSGRPSAYKGSYGTSVVKVGNLNAGAVGYTEARLKSLGIEYRKIYLHPASNASYYPGSARLSMKVLFGNDGKLFGAQIIGAKGVDKRIDTIALAMRYGIKAPELAEMELAYAPPFSSAKDPVNFAGFIAENILNGLSDVVYPDTIPEGAVIMDTREEAEHALGSIPGSINIPLGQIRSRLDELDKSKFYVVHCQVGLRGYLAERILKQNGFRAANLSGGWLTWNLFHPQPDNGTNAPKKQVQTVISASSETLDVRALPCPGPVIKLKNKAETLKAGESFHLLAALTFEGDLKHWTQSNGFALANLAQKETWIEADILKGEASAQSLCASCTTGADSAAIVLFSNDLDKALAAMILANGFAAAGMKVNMFFTFWGLSVLRKNPAPYVHKNLIGKMFGRMLPNGAKKLALSKMHMLGMGSAMMRDLMAKHNVPSLPELIASAKASGVRFIACEMAMDLMGLQREELIDIDEVAGVATFAALAKNSGPTLFI